MKTRTFVLNDTITAKRIKELMKRIELCKANNINLYLSSHGGDSEMADIFVDFTHRTNKKINLIACGYVASACADIFIESKGKKSIYAYAVMLVHGTTFNAESRLLTNKKSLDSILLKERQKINENRINLYDSVFNLTNKEVSLLKNGGDFVIDYDRLKKALPKINKLKK